MKWQTQRFCEFGPFRIDLNERVLLREGRPVSLTPKALDCLLVLVENSGHIVEKGELMQRVWPDTFVEEMNLARHVSTLRKVLGDSSDDHQYIETIPKRGYRFVAGVREVQDVGAELIVEEHIRSDILIEELTNSETDQASRTSETAIAAVALSRHHFAGRFKLVSLLVTLALMIGLGGWLIASRLASKSSARSLRIVPLTSFPGSESQASFSPDGNQIAFVWDGDKDNWDIYVKLIDTGAPLRLTTSPSPDINPVWSPDGRSIAFLRRSTERSAVYVIPSLAGTERKLAEVNVINYGSSLDWSPDGKLLAAVDRTTPKEPYSIFFLSVETGEKHQLTFPSREYNGDTNPAFSPEGRTLAFIRIGSMGVSELYVAPVAGGEPRRLTFEKATIIGLAWTPEGSEIVFRLSRAGYTTLWRISASGGTPEQLPSIGDEAIEPAISRRGNRLAYTRRLMDPNIWRTEVPGPTGRGSSPIKLISSTLADVSPQFSADGKRIAFVSNRAGSPEIWECDSEGLNPIQLTTFGGTHTGTPRWSPDSEHIAFDSRPQGHADIYVVSTRIGKARRLTKDTSEDVVPSWSRDGRWIYFGSNRSGDWQVWRVAAEGGEAVQVTSKGGFEAFESPDGKFVYYAKSRDVPGPLWRLPVDGGDETSVPGFTKAVPWGQWAVLDHGIYFINAETRSAIEFFSFATGQVTQVVALEKRVFGGPSFSVSPDGRRILYVQVDRNDSDLMLVDNFH
jgi:Tol biopolymer transport system component/DNA-binding winged helix-turn-helix (wHTH) protein